MDRGFQIGHFEIDQPLGSGGMATVWRVRHRDTGTAAALKALHLRGRHDVQSAFALEVRAMAKMRHPHVVHIYDHGVLRNGPLAGAPYLVSELCSGGDLRSQRDRFSSWPALKELITQLLAGLGHAHGLGILHRDLKMGNILFATREDVRPGLKLADFGIASVAGEQAVDFGTPEYAAPELSRGVGIGPGVDLYALGILVWRLCTGAFPFRGPKLELAKVEENPSTWAPLFDVPKGLETWLCLLLRANPAERFQSAPDALAQLPKGEPRPISPRKTGPRTLRTFLAPPPPVPIPPAAFERAPALPAPALSRTGLSLLGLRHIPLLGRDKELETLWNAALGVQTHNRPHTLAVVGPRGAGHTALARTFVAQLRETSGCLVLAESPSGRPGRAVLESLLRSALGMDAQRHWTRARKALDHQGISTPRIQAGLDQLAAGRQRFLPATLASTLSAISAQRPVVVWMDGPRDAVLQRFVEAAPAYLDGPILIAVSGSDSGPPGWQRVALEPLSGSTLAIALQHLAPVELADALDIAEQSGGWPAAAVRQVRTRFRRATPTAVALDFAPQEWAIIQAAVTLGGRVPRVHLPNVADVTPEDVVLLEDTLLRDGLITVHRGHWLLDPALERAGSDRPAVYTHAARWAVALGEDPEADPLARVRSLLSAGRPDEAASLTLALRKRIHRAHGTLAELSLVRDCLDALEGLPLKPDLQGALWVREIQVSGHQERTLDLGLRRARDAARLGWMEEAAQCLFAAAYMQPMPIKGDLLDQALAHAPEGTSIRAKTLHSLAFQGARRNQDGWRAHAQESLAILDTLQDSDATLHALSLRRFLAREDEDFALAATLGRAVVGLARTEDLGALDMHLCNLADCYIRQGDLDQADAALQEATILAELTGQPSRVGAALVNRIVVAGKRSDWESLERIRVRLEAHALIPHIAGIVHTYALLSKLGLGDLDAARARLAPVRAYLDAPHEREPDTIDALIMSVSLAEPIDRDFARELHALAQRE